MSRGEGVRFATRADQLRGHDMRKMLIPVENVPFEKGHFYQENHHFVGGFSIAIFDSGCPMFKKCWCPRWNSGPKSDVDPKWLEVSHGFHPKRNGIIIIIIIVVINHEYTRIIIQ